MRRKHKKKSGSKTLRKIAIVKLSPKIARRVQRALKKCYIPSRIRKIGRKHYLDLRPKESAKKIISKNIRLRNALKR